MKKVLILGSTGSIGLSTLDVLARNPDQFELWGITANSNSAQLLEQIRQYQPEYAVINDEVAALDISKKVKAEGIDTKVLTGAENLQELAGHDEVDIVMAAIVGAAGLLPTLKAVEAGKRVLLANKEALVCAGPLFMQAVSRSNALLMPVDSEHNAIFQCLPDGQYNSAQIEKILLTASGGPFRGKSFQELSGVTPEQACAHPNWNMGQKISVDSATMMNKGLELIEACWLFGVSSDQIDIVLHPQSVVHSMVQYRDGSVIAQMGNPDMRTPIAHALSWPERTSSGVDILDFARLKLDFEEIDYLGYPFSISETFQLRNTNATIEQSLSRVEEMQNLCVQNNKKMVVYISMAFGNPYGDPWSGQLAAQWTEKLTKDLGIEIIALADTVGVSNGENITELFSTLIPEFPSVEIGAHLHTLPEDAQAKALLAYNSGCRRFDAAVKGYGGCPMAEDDLVGNMATELLIDALKEVDQPSIDEKEFSKAMLLAGTTFPL